jgi:hypothetical protein
LLSASATIEKRGWVTPIKMSDRVRSFEEIAVPDERPSQFSEPLRRLGETTNDE